jgi:hypothetical protein
MPVPTLRRVLRKSRRELQEIQAANRLSGAADRELISGARAVINDSHDLMRRIDRQLGIAPKKPGD